MKIKLNGQERQFPESQNLKAIVNQFCKDTRHIIAEVNGLIVKNPSWEETTIQEGDRVELVNFVGGG
jgi:sulfur carrier protein